MSAVNPILRDQHEYIIVLSKGDFKRKKDTQQKGHNNKKRILRIH